MSEETAIIDRKVRRAMQMLLFQRHRQPGVKGWELRSNLGKDYMKVVELLNLELEKLGLKVKIASSSTDNPSKLSGEELDRARFFVTLSGKLRSSDAVMAGWRIDDVAVLAVSIAYIISRQGKAPRAEVERLLKQKLLGWRVDFSLDRFIRMGYLAEDENGLLHIDWRARAEVDEKTLLELILAEEGESKNASLEKS